MPITTEQYNDFVTSFNGMLFNKFKMVDMDSAHDAVVDAYIDICKRLEQNQTISNIFGYWMTSATNKFIDKMRHNQIENKIFSGKSFDEIDFDENNNNSYPSNMAQPYATIEFMDEIDKLPDNARRLAIFALENKSTDVDGWYLSNVKNSYRSLRTAKEAIRRMFRW